jgi:hypothetical protein
MEEPIAGQMVAIVIPGLSGGKPMYVPCVVAEPNSAKAEEIVRAVIDHGEDAKAIGPLTKRYIDGFGLKPGEFTHWRWKP